MNGERDATLSDGDTGEYPVVWRETRDGITAEVVAEQYVDENFDPRGADNLGIMVCWHPDYYLGDEQIRDGDGRGAVKTEHKHSSRIRSMGTLARWATLIERAPCVLPLYLYDHSGISMSAGSGLIVGETPSGGYDEFGSPRGWDTTLCGIIYTTPERIAELCGDPRYKPDGFDGTHEEWIATQLRQDVAIYDRYLRGEVYYWRVAEYAIEDGEPDYEEEVETFEGCGGYLPNVSAPFAAELDYVKQEARESRDATIEARKTANETERVERERAARMDVATVQA